MNEKECFQKIDLAVYEEELKGFIPPKIFDFHIHLWGKKAFLKPLSGKIKASMPFSHIKSFVLEDLEKTYDKLFPGIKWEGLIFGVPLIEMDLEIMNGYIKEILKKEKGKYFGLFIPSLELTANKLAQVVKEGNFFGFKPYYTMVKDKHKDEIRISDFVTPAQLEVTNDKGLVILLHLPRKDRIADPVNIEDLIRICRAYPKARIVLAHIGRSYGPYFLEKAIDKIKGLKNLYYDLAMVNDGEVIELLLENVSPSKVIYGTDIPIALERGKHLCINRQCVFITRKKFAWSISDKDLECTYFVYETIRALKWATKRKRLSSKEIEDIFYNNAKSLLQCPF